MTAQTREEIVPNQITAGRTHFRFPILSLSLCNNIGGVCRKVAGANEGYVVMRMLLIDERGGRGAEGRK